MDGVGYLFNDGTDHDVHEAIGDVRLPERLVVVLDPIISIEVIPMGGIGCSLILFISTPDSCCHKGGYIDDRWCISRGKGVPHFWVFSILVVPLVPIFVSHGSVFKASYSRKPVVVI